MTTSSSIAPVARYVDRERTGSRTSVLVPLQCEFYALEGLSQLMRTIDAVKAGLNGALSMQGIVLTMFDSRNKLSAMVANDVRDHFGELVYNTVVPRNVRAQKHRLSGSRC